MRSSELLEFFTPGARINVAEPAPGLRVAAWLIASVVVGTATVACCVSTEIVAVADGRLVVSQQTKKVQALELARIKKIFVRDGDTVVTGDPLIQLASEQNEADLAVLRTELKEQNIEEEVTTCLLQRLNQKNCSANSPSAQNRLDTEFANIQMRLARANAEIIQREAERNAAGRQLDRLAAGIPLLEKRLDDHNRLRQNGFLSHQALENTQRELDNAKLEVKSSQAAVKVATAQWVVAVRDRDSTATALALDLNNRRERSIAKIEQIGLQIASASRKISEAIVRAPVSGTIQELAVHTVDGTVTPAQTLAFIVPRNHQLEAELRVASSEIGFIHSGQKVHIKVDSFPYTRYGMLSGVVTMVSKDALESQDSRTPTYSISVSLENRTGRFLAENLALSPGMGVRGEVVTGIRTFAEYFLAPFQRVSNEAFKER